MGLGTPRAAFRGLRSWEWGRTQTAWRKSASSIASSFLGITIVCAKRVRLASSTPYSVRTTLMNLDSSLVLGKVNEVWTRDGV